ncbi:MAG TPA: FixH family protein [Polyangia bacterium]|nr:FixH family protein [Polyangia bacterium]
MLRTWHTVALAVCVVGCGAAPAADAPPLSFSAAPAETVTSDGGGLRIEVRWSPETPVKGQDAAQLRFLDASGEVVDGLVVETVPWMPAHGHGTSIQPVSTPAGPGLVVASPVDLYMSGEWQLRMTISGKVDDSAIATVQIP